MPGSIYTSVKVEKTAQLDRDNDKVYQANLKVLIQIKELQTQCNAQGTTPDQLLKLVATIGQACRQLCEGSLRCIQSNDRISYSNYGLFLINNNGGGGLTV